MAGHVMMMSILQGWLDITYLSPDGQFRLSRGNKGTLFVLVRDPSPREQLLQAIERGQKAEVEEAIELLQSKGSPVSKPAKSGQVFGRWRLRWSKQVSISENFGHHVSSRKACLTYRSILKSAGFGEHMPFRHLDSAGINSGLVCPCCYNLVPRCSGLAVGKQQVVGFFMTKHFCHACILQALHSLLVMLSKGF